MDEKEFDLGNVVENVQLSEDLPAEGKAQVKFEENDNWQFEADAPTLADNFLDNGEVEIAIPKEKPAVMPYSQISANTGVASVKPKAKNKDTAKFVLTGVLIVVITAALAFLGVRYYTVANTDEKMNPGNVALTVGDTDVSIGMYNYYYSIISQNYIQYAAYGYYDLDTSLDYSNQKTTDQDGNETTWANLFVQSTIDQLQYITSYYEAAVKSGVTLTEDQQKAIDEQLKSVKDDASESNKSVDEYVAETYGDYCGYATLKKMLEQCYMAENYYKQRQVEVKASDDEIDSYYNEHKDDYLEVSFAYLQMPYDENNVDTVKKNAQSYAKKIKSVKDIKKLVPVACKEMIEQYVSAGYFENADECAQAIAESLETSIAKSDTSFGEESVKWLFDDAVKTGQSTVTVDEENGIVYVLLKTGTPAIQDKEVYNVRHILIAPESESEEEQSAAKQTYTDEEWAAAEEEANKILDEFNKTDKSEYSFALLAEKYSDDVESTSNGSGNIFGGLCEGSQLGMMVPSFEKWSVDKSRKYGDTDIVKSDFGYHIMFFINDTEYYKHQCAVAVKQQKESDFVKNAAIKKHASVMKKTKVAKPEANTQTDSDNVIDESLVEDDE